VRVFRCELSNLSGIRFGRLRERHPLLGRAAQCSVRITPVQSPNQFHLINPTKERACDYIPVLPGLAFYLQYFIGISSGSQSSISYHLPISLQQAVMLAETHNLCQDVQGWHRACSPAASPWPCQNVLSRFAAGPDKFSQCCIASVCGYLPCGRRILLMLYRSN
jgi:hypothetical protein